MHLFWKTNILRHFNLWIYIHDSQCHSDAVSKFESSFLNLETLEQHFSLKIPDQVTKFTLHGRPSSTYKYALNIALHPPPPNLDCSYNVNSFKIMNSHFQSPNNLQCSLGNCMVLYMDEEVGESEHWNSSLNIYFSHSKTTTFHSSVSLNCVVFAGCINTFKKWITPHLIDSWINELQRLQCASDLKELAFSDQKQLLQCLDGWKQYDPQWKICNCKYCWFNKLSASPTIFYEHAFQVLPSFLHFNVKPQKCLWCHRHRRDIILGFHFCHFFFCIVYVRGVNFWCVAAFQKRDELSSWTIAIFSPLWLVFLW